MKNKIIFLVIIASTCLFSLTVFANPRTQTTSLTLTSGNINFLQSPDNFGFNPAFIDPNNVTFSYKTLHPSIEENLLIFEDANVTGDNFRFSVTLSNLIDGNKVIPFDAFSIVTISNSPTGLDRYSPTSPESTDVDITTPANCPWNGNITTNCETEFNNNMFTYDTPTSHNTDPQNTIDETTTVINVDPAIEFYYGSIIQFDNGEKALITAVSPDHTSITVHRGILGTTTSPHNAGSGITCLGPSSKAIDIIVAPEPATPRIGAYSMGFGFRNTIQPYLQPGNYNGILTISLTIY